MAAVNQDSELLLVTCFTLMGSNFGLDASRVLEVVRVGDSTPIHNAPKGVLGIKNLRGKIVTVLDLATHLGLGSVASSEDNRLLIIDANGELYGFLVDGVHDTLQLEAKHLHDAPPSMLPALQNRIAGVWRDQDSITTILNVEALFVWDDTL